MIRTTLGGVWAVDAPDVSAVARQQRESEANEVKVEDPQSKDYAAADRGVHGS